MCMHLILDKLDFSSVLNFMVCIDYELMKYVKV